MKKNNKKKKNVFEEAVKKKSNLKWSNSTRKTSDLIPYTDNPRKMSPEQAQHLLDSLEKFNLVEIPAINLNNKILAGHMRVAALKSLGRGKETIDVRIPNRRLTEEEEKEYLLRSNKNRGDWDQTLLQKFNEELLIDVGFGPNEIDEILPGPINLVDADEVPELPKKPISKTGDIYQLGKHRVMCGNSTNTWDIHRLMKGKKADIVFTDPPYGISIVKQKGNVGVSGKLGFVGATGVAKARMYKKIEGDDKPFDPSFILNMAKIIILFGANHYSDKLPCNSHWLVWDKKSDNAERKNTFSDAELLWTNINKKTTNIYRHQWFGLVREGDRKTELSERVHPTQKPVGLLAEVIKDYTKINGSLLDLFGGSGSTLIACEKTNHKCYMMEIAPIYVDVIVKRWENFTDQKAKKC